MAKLLSICPKCRTSNEVINTGYMRLDGGTSVVCVNCSLRFHAILSNEDIKNLYDETSNIPKVNGEKDYILNSEFYPD